MAPAQAPFADYLAKVEFRESVVPVIGNVHAAPLDVAGAREELVAHLVSPVQFEASVAKLQRPARRCSRKWASAACSPIS
ncbi:MAG: hypothetical protein ACLTEX_10610 [Eggerthella lenta]